MAATKEKKPLTEEALVRMPEADYMNSAQLAFFRERLEHGTDHLRPDHLELVGLHRHRADRAHAAGVGALVTVAQPLVVTRGGKKRDGAAVGDRKSTRLNSSHMSESRMPSSA